MKRILCILAALCLAPCMSPGLGAVCRRLGTPCRAGLPARGRGRHGHRRAQFPDGQRPGGHWRPGRGHATGVGGRRSPLQNQLPAGAGRALRRRSPGKRQYRRRRARHATGAARPGLLHGRDRRRVWRRNPRGGGSLPDRQRPGPHRHGGRRHADASARGEDAHLAELHRRQALPTRRFRRGRALVAAAAEGDGLLRRRSAPTPLARPHSARCSTFRNRTAWRPPAKPTRPPAACSTPGRAYRSWTMAYCARATRARPSAHCNSSSMPSATWQCSPTATLARTPTWP